MDRLRDVLRGRLAGAGGWLPAEGVLEGLRSQAEWAWLTTADLHRAAAEDPTGVLQCRRIGGGGLLMGLAGRGATTAPSLLPVETANPHTASAAASGDPHSTREDEGGRQTAARGPSGPDQGDGRADRDSAIRAALQGCLHAPEESRRLAEARRLAGLLEGEKLLDALLPALSDDAPMVRHAALQALGEVLRADNPSPPVRPTLWSSPLHGTHPGPRVAATLRAMLADENAPWIAVEVVAAAREQVSAIAGGHGPGDTDGLVVDAGSADTGIADWRGILSDAAGSPFAEVRDAAG